MSLGRIGAGEPPEPSSKGRRQLLAGGRAGLI
jgi:hypothetical protein